MATTPQSMMQEGSNDMYVHYYHSASVLQNSLLKNCILFSKLCDIYNAKLESVFSCLKFSANAGMKKSNSIKTIGSRGMKFSI